ncbi:MAG: sulfatase [Planctomycetaceae bacterium]|nr:sulfatase [Planctomycetaceae bacterium]
MTLETRRRVWSAMAFAIAWACAGRAVAASEAGSSPLPARPNVLFLAIDDLNDWVGCLKGHPQVQTPHIDALAARGTLFTNAHCQAPLCNPSRSSVLTGLRPSTTGVYGLAPGLRDVAELRNHVTLPQTFTRAGYYTATCGKIFHDGSIPQLLQATEFSTWGPAPGMPKPPQKLSRIAGGHPLMDWGVFPPRDQEQADWKIATAAVEQLRSAPRDKPFFIGCGFRLPHVPCFASQRWFDLYPDNRLIMPMVREDDREDTPRFSWYLHWKLPEPRLATLQRHNDWRPLVQAYLASISFVDSQVGRVLKALDESGRAERTIIVLWSDHGWHLGEKGITGKNTLWERSTRIPLILAGPEIARNAVCAEPVELLDLFPTLLERCGFPARPDLEGHSLGPQLREATTPRPWPAITTHNQGNHSVRTRDWRYIRYADGSEELYDHRIDPNEWTNLASRDEMSETLRELRRWLPRIDRPAVPGSKHRVLLYDPATKAVSWEGTSIGSDDPIPNDE